VASIKVDAVDSGRLAGNRGGGRRAALERAVRDLPVDETRVAVFRGAIEGGTYTISPQRIAEHLLLLEHTLGAFLIGDGQARSDRG
jgi:hypothetical protein